MKKSKKENSDLSFQFEHPLDGIQSTFINSDSQAEQLLSEIEQQIKNRDDWSVRSSGIQLALSCLKGGITNYSSIDYSSFSSDLAHCLTDLRSSLVKSGSLLVAASSQILQERYITSIKIIIPALFKQLSHGTAIISESARFALIEITKNVQNSKTYHTIISKVQSKSCQQRLIIAEVLFIIIDKWPTSKTSTFAESINSSLHQLIEDASQNVRKAARKTMLLFKSKCAKENGLMPNINSKNQKKNLNGGKEKKSAFTLSMRNSLTKVSKIPKVPKLVDTQQKPKPKQKKIRSCSPVKGSARPMSALNMKTVEKQSKKEQEQEKPTKNQSRSQSQIFHSKSLQSKNKTTNKSPVQQEKNTPVKQQKLYFITPYPRKNQKVQFVDTSDTDDLHTPRETKQFSFTLPSFQPKGILKPSNYPNIIRKSEIEYYMPPKSMNDAESFREAIIDTIDTEMYEKFDGIEGLLCPSIITAVKFIPGIDEWDNIIPILLSQFPDDFVSNIHELIAAFRCDPWLISYSCDVFGSQHVAEMFAFSNLNLSEKKNNKYKLKFFCSLFEQKIPIQITDNLQLFLKKLVEQNQNYDDIKYIEDALDQTNNHSKDIEQTIAGILQKIKSGHDCSEDASNLNTVIENSPNKISIAVQILEDELPQIIQGNRDAQIYSIYSFIQNVPSISFSFIADSMIYLLSITNPDDNHELVDKTKDCLLSMMNNLAVFSFILESLDSSDDQYEEEEDQIRQQTTLSILLNYFQKCNEQTAVDLLPDTFNQLSPILESDITSLRRIVVLIFVEFKCKIPEAFEFYADKIPTKHQKLIELYTSRRKVRTA